MFRIGLIAYLSLATVFGPFVCCCSAHRLTGHSLGRQLSATAGSSSTSGGNGRLAKNVLSGGASCCHKQSSERAGSQQKDIPSPSEGNGSHCPCGNRHATVVAATANDTSLKVVELSDHLWSAPVAILSSDFDRDLLTNSVVLCERPAGLYGRQMLRAYHILRC